MSDKRNMRFSQSRRPDPTAHDPLGKSRAIQEDASAQGFDWPDISGVFEKVREELDEIESAWRQGHSDKAGAELGDTLFALVNLARFLGADPVEQLERANMRFSERFALLSNILQREGRVMSECTLDELDEVWERVKIQMEPERLGGA